nr:hypothetical protein [Tanacetum cinerariifolium]
MSWLRLLFPSLLILPRRVSEIRGIQEHLLEVPIQEELRALKDSVETAKAERAPLRATIRTIGAVEMSLHNHMRDER